MTMTYEDDRPAYPQSRAYNRRKDAFVGALQIIAMSSAEALPSETLLCIVLDRANRILEFYEGTGDGTTD